MTSILLIKSRKLIKQSAVFLLALVVILATAGFSATEHTAAYPLISSVAFQQGETLTYNVSWSNMITAGKAVLEVERETLPEGRNVLALTVTGYSTGVIEKIYHVQDRAQSVFDPLIGQSLSYYIQQIHGKKKRQHRLIFNSDRGTVISKLNDDAPEIFEVPDHILDTLSALYRIRMMDDFTIGRSTTINVFESDKNWSVEIQTLGREKVKTPAGEFDTIKLKTLPRSGGVFLNKGVAFLWLSDDDRKIPVLMKSSLKVGSFVFTLIDMKQGKALH